MQQGPKILPPRAKQSRAVHPSSVPSQGTRHIPKGLPWARGKQTPSAGGQEAAELLPISAGETSRAPFASPFLCGSAGGGELRAGG